MRVFFQPGGTYPFGLWHLVSKSHYASMIESLLYDYYRLWFLRSDQIYGLISTAMKHIDVLADGHDVAQSQTQRKLN